MKKVLVFVASLVVCTLLAEGALSLFLGRSLRTLGQRSFLERLEEQDLAGDRAAFLQAVRSAGTYRVAEDPLVAYTLRLDAELDYLEQPIHTDGLGLRVRAEPPAPGAFRLVVLGDSVAYG